MKNTVLKSLLGQREKVLEKIFNMNTAYKYYEVAKQEYQKQLDRLDELIAEYAGEDSTND
jgi:predicted house-cleaning noncanonical NTP pyrophosphatase (MazG superfamily)